MNNPEIIPQILIQIALGISLAACAGIRAFLPVLVIGILARFNWIQVGDNFTWISSTPCLIIFGISTIVEILGDKFPAVDHILDSSQVFIKPVAGTVLFSAIVVKMDPMLAVVLGIIAGGTLAELVHIEKAGVRVLSTSITGGGGNPLLSFIEDVTAAVGVLISILVPVVALILLILTIFLTCRFIKKLAKKPQETELPNPTPPPNPQIEHKTGDSDQPRINENTANA